MLIFCFILLSFFSKIFSFNPAFDFPLTWLLFFLAVPVFSLMQLLFSLSVLVFFFLVQLLSSLSLPVSSTKIKGKCFLILKNIMVYIKHSTLV